MKRMFLAVSLFALAVGVAIAQDKGSVRQQTTPVRQVHVTSKTIDRLAGKAYIIDLTQDRTVYDVAADIDYCHVRIRMPKKGEMPLSDAATQLHITGTRFLIGSADDVSRLDFGFPSGDTSQPSGGGVSGMTCNGIICGCTGKKDCNDMAKSGRPKVACGKMSADAPANDFGRTPGTWGCVAYDPSHT